MSDETMIERVAKAIDPLVYHMRPAEEIARAAIEAMREPTQSMIREGNMHDGNWQHAAMVWHAMIDAALNEKAAADP